MMITTVIISLHCDYNGCNAHAKFEGYNQTCAIQRARKHNWAVSLPDKIRCSVHKGKRQRPDKQTAVCR